MYTIKQITASGHAESFLKGLTGKGLWEESLSLKYLVRLENSFPSLLAIRQAPRDFKILIFSVNYKNCDAKDCVVAVIQYKTF